MRRVVAVLAALAQLVVSPGPELLVVLARPGLPALEYSGLLSDSLTAVAPSTLVFSFLLLS